MRVGALDRKKAGQPICDLQNVFVEKIKEPFHNYQLKAEAKEKVEKANLPTKKLVLNNEVTFDEQDVLNQDLLRKRRFTKIISYADKIRLRWTGPEQM